MPGKLKIMKKFTMLAFFAIAGLFLQKADSQVNIGVNIGSQPVWGPAGYD